MEVLTSAWRNPSGISLMTLGEDGLGRLVELLR